MDLEPVWFSELMPFIQIELISNSFYVTIIHSGSTFYLSIKLNL